MSHDLPAHIAQRPSRRSQAGPVFCKRRAAAHPVPPHKARRKAFDEEWARCRRWAAGSQFLQTPYELLMVMRRTPAEKAAAEAEYQAIVAREALEAQAETPAPESGDETRCDADPAAPADPAPTEATPGDGR